MTVVSHDQMFSRFWKSSLDLNRSELVQKECEDAKANANTLKLTLKLQSHPDMTPGEKM